MFLEGFIAIIIFAFVPLAIKSTAATPITICIFRLAMAVFFLVILWRKKIQFKSFLFKENGSYKLWLIGIIFCFHWIFYAYGVKLGGPSIGVLGMSTYGVQLAIAGVFFLGHRVTKKDIFCLLLSIVGIFTIIPTWNFKDESAFGAILSLLSATCFALLPIIHQKSQKFSLETRIFAQFFGALISFIFFIGKANWELEKHDWWTLIFLGIFGTLIAHSLWARVSSTASPVNSGLAYYTIAPLTILLSHLLFGENFTFLQILGAFIIIIAALVNIFPFSHMIGVMKND